MKWKIWGNGYELPELIIEADSFDEALSQARRVDSKYNGGQVCKED